MRKATFGIVLAAAILSLPAICMAGPVTIFDNTNPISSICCGYAIGLYPSTTSTYTSYAAFTPTGSNYLLTSVGLVASLGTGGSPLDLFLYSSSGGQPGTLLESWLNVAVGSSLSLVTQPSVGSLILNEGQQYWLGATTNNPQAEDIWWINPALTQGLGCYTVNGGPYNCATTVSGLVAFQILGTPTSATPEPSSLLLLSSGLLGLGPFIRRRLACR